MGTLLVSLGNEGKVAQVDRRVGTSAVSTFNLFDRLHAKSVSCNPLKPHLLLTGTNKGGCFIYDLRSSRKSSGLLTPLVELQGATRSLSSCQFSPSGSQVVTISTDDKFRLYNTENITGSTLQPAAQVRHNNQTGRWLTPFRATWHPTRENAFLTGSMERPRRMEVWSSAENKLSMVAKLSGDEMANPQVLVGAVPAVVPYHNCVNKVTEVCYPVQKVEPTTVTEQSCLLKGEVECTEVVVATIPRVTCSHAEHTKPADEAVETE